MCRIVGIAAARGNVMPRIMMSLVAQSYAGEEGCGVAVESPKESLIKTWPGAANEVFRRLHHQELPGKIGIGHVACRTGVVQPTTIGKAGVIAFCADATKDVCQKIATILGDGHSPEEMVKTAMNEIDEPFALLVLLPSAMIAARNSGRMPLSHGKLSGRTGGNYVASQSGVLGLDAKFIHSIFPGELVNVSQSGLQRQAVLERPNLTRCSQEPLFWQRPGNYCGHRDTNTIRQLVGRALGYKFQEQVPVKNPQEYIAIPIPEGGTSIILGFGQSAGIPIDPAGAVKSRYPKSALMSANMDLFPIGEVIEGKKVVIVDDALIGGSKLQTMAKRSLELGAKEVHGVIGTLIQQSCPFGKDILCANSQSPERIIKDAHLVTLTFLTPKELIDAIDIPHRIYCTECLEIPSPD